MWGREMRAGLVFVLLSVAAGSAWRGWQRAHTRRFDEIVASLVDAAARDGAAGAPPASGAPADSARAGPSPDAAASPPTRARRAVAPALRPASIDVDRASTEELIRLPGIGPALAARIVAERQAGRFGGPEGLLRVPGIGQKTLAKIRPYLAPASSPASGRGPNAPPAPAEPETARAK